VNKRELVAEIAARTRQPASEVAEVVDAFISSVSKAVAKGDKVVLSGFGTFHRRTRAKRVARNIWAGEKIRVPATNVPDFRPGKPFKEAVARRRARSAGSSAAKPRRRPPSGA
jgi:DNA-binding protein HU-beta